LLPRATSRGKVSLLDRGEEEDRVPILKARKYGKHTANRGGFRYRKKRKKEIKLAF